jgi:hypothetical protein
MAQIAYNLGERKVLEMNYFKKYLASSNLYNPNKICKKIMEMIVALLT